MKEEVQERVTRFEQEHDAKVIYVSQTGSKLYGTDNPNSDTDYIGLFVPSVNSVLLKKDLEHWSADTNTSSEKNEAGDVDFKLYSIYKFLSLVKKGETGAMDLLFSMFREYTIEFQSYWHTNLFREHAPKLVCKNVHSFVGYCVGQSKKYGVKGTRYTELKSLMVNVNTPTFRAEEKLEKYWSLLTALSENYEYVRMFTEESNSAQYLEVLGRKYQNTITVGHLLEKLTALEKSYGARTKSAREGTDWKALSHSVRIVDEAEELLDTKFITFPLKNKEYVKQVKEQKVPLEDVLQYLDEKIDLVNMKEVESKLPKQPSQDLIDKLLLRMVD